MQSIYTFTSIHSQYSFQSLESLIFGIEELDKLFGGLRLGELVTFYGSQMCHTISELLCVRSQLSPFEGETESSVVFIDGGNLFDPYFISETARLHGLNPEEILKKIWISRAFTSYQMVALITERLTPLIEQTGSRLIIISDIAALFCDSDIGIAEAMRTFNRITLFLWKLVREQDIVLLASSLSSRSKKKRLLDQYLLCRSDVVARFEAEISRVKVNLEKHPSKLPTSTEVFCRVPNVQSLL